MDKPIFFCPKCGKKLFFNKKTNYLTCFHIFCNYESSLIEYNLAPDIALTLGTTKTNGLITFLINSQTKQFAIETEKNDNIYSEEYCCYGPYAISEITEIQILQEEIINNEIKRNCIPMLTGGILFGSFGAIAGSLMSKTSENLKAIKNNTLLIKINDIRIPSVYIEIKDNDILYKFLATIELLKNKTKKRATK